MSRTTRIAAVPLLSAMLLLGSAGSALAIPNNDDDEPGLPPNRAPSAALTVSPNPALVSQLLPINAAVTARVVDLGDVINRGGVSFNAAGSSDPDGAIVKYEWDLDGNGSFEKTTTAAKVTRAYSVPGTFLVKVRVTDNRGATDVQARSLLVHRAPRAALSATPATVILGQGAALSAAGSTDDNGIAKFEFDLDGNGSFETATGTTPTASASFTTLGTKTVRVRVTDTNGATATASTQIVVHRAPTAAFSAAPSPAVVGEQVVFDGSSSSDDEPIAKYEWDLDGNGSFETNTGASPKATRTFAAPGTATVRLRVTDSRGVQDAVARELTILAQPPADRLAPIMRIGALSSRISRTGRVTLTVACPAGERLCLGRLSLRTRGARSSAVGSREFRLAGGERAQIRVLLSRSARRAVKRRGRLAIRITLSVRDAAGNAATARRTLTIRK
jgi:YD repeat-containing protein